MADNMQQPVAVNRNLFSDKGNSAGLGTIIMPRERENGSQTASINANARASAHLGEGIKLMGSASVPVKVDKAVNSRAAQDLIDLEEGRASVGLRRDGDSVTYTRGSDDQGVDVKVGGLGLGYNLGSDGKWSARANIEQALQHGANFSAGMSTNSNKRHAVNASYRKGNFGVRGQVNRDGDVRASLNYKF